jgi:nitrogen fixation/metabolism regulation signal transduction histidine kinase
MKRKIKNIAYSSVKDLKKRKRFIGIIFAILLVYALIIAIQSRFIYFSSIPVSNTVLMFILLNINLLLLILLIFLVFRNIAKLLYERKHKIMGAKLRTKLIVAFISLSLIPTSVLFYFSIRFITSSTERWFNLPIEQALNNSLIMGQQFYDYIDANNRFYFDKIEYQIKTRQLLDDEKRDDLERYIEIVQSAFNMDGLEIYNINYERIIISTSSKFDQDELASLPVSYFNRDIKRKIIEKNKKGEVLRSIGKIILEKKDKKPSAFIVISFAVPTNISHKMASIAKGFEEYQQIKLLKEPIKDTYYIALSIVALIVIFCAVWFGFYLANSISIPIKELAEGTRRIAEGDLNFRINVVGDDEISSLVTSFNKMTRDLLVGRDQLEKAQRMAAWREVAQRIAHEVKNPLTPISLSAQRLNRRYSQNINEPVFNECIETITDHVELIRNLVNEFAKFANFPAISKQPSNIAKIIEETIALYKNSSRYILFDFKNPDNIKEIRIDRHQMKQVMINLIDNAISAIEKKGEINILIFHIKENNLIKLEIADTGVGITKEGKTRLFEPYFSTKEKGMGLGLVIVNSIIAGHNGKITIEDNKPCGAKFIITLPYIT